MSYIARDLLSKLNGLPRITSSDPAAPASNRWVQSGLLMFFSDLITAQLVTCASYWLLFTYVPFMAALHLDAGALFLVAVSFAAADSWVGLHGYPPLGAVERFRRRLLGALLTPWLALGLISWEQPPGPALIAFLVINAALLFPFGLVAVGLVHRRWPGAGAAKTLLVGNYAVARQIASYLQARSELGLTPVGFVNEAPNTEPESLPWMGRLSELHRLAASVDVVAITSPLDLAALDIANLPVRRVVVFHAADEGTSLDCSLRAPKIFEARNPPGYTGAKHLKRILELCIAVPALVVAAPVIGLAALAIKIVSRGPALYIQRRVGWGGQSVSIHKLRSMYPDAEARLKRLLEEDPLARQEWSRFMKLRRDPRILPHIGSFIRKTSIDELPQLWDVVTGKIALVGPRPFPEYHVAKFPPEFQILRASVKPGLTGLWQVSERSEADLRQQQAVDTFYITNWSLWLDAYIVARTFAAVFLAHGAR